MPGRDVPDSNRRPDRRMQADHRLRALRDPSRPLERGQGHPRRTRTTEARRTPDHPLLRPQAQARDHDEGQARPGHDRHQPPEQAHRPCDTRQAAPRSRDHNHQVRDTVPTHSHADRDQIILGLAGVESSERCSAPWAAHSSLEADRFNPPLQERRQGGHSRDALSRPTLRSIGVREYCSNHVEIDGGGVAIADHALAESQPRASSPTGGRGHPA